MIALLIASILGGFLAQIADPKYLQYAIIIAFSLNILLILITKSCEANENLFTQFQTLDFWQILPHARLYLILRPYLRIVTLITLVAYPAIYLILYAFDLKIIFAFSIGMFFSMVVSGVAWGWMLSWFLMGWPTPIRDEELDVMNRLN